MVHLQQRRLILGLCGGHCGAAIPGVHLRQNLALFDRIALMDENFLDHALEFRLHLCPVSGATTASPSSRIGSGNSTRNMTVAIAATLIIVRRVFSSAMNLRFRSSTGSSTEMNGTSLYICALRSATVAWLANTSRSSICT